MQAKELYAWTDEAEFETIYKFAIVMKLEKEGSLQDAIDKKIALRDD